MSTIETFYNSAFSSKRMVKSGSNRLDTESDIVTSQPCLFRPVQHRSQLFNADNFGKEFTMQCSNTLDIKAGDTVIISSKRYGVIGLSNYEDTIEGLDSHLHVSLVLKSA